MEEVFVEIECPVCDGSDFDTIVEITPSEFLNDFRKGYYNLNALKIGLDTKFYIQQCKKCTFVMLNPRFNNYYHNIAYNDAKKGQYDKYGWMFEDGELKKLYNTHKKYYASIILLESIAFLKKRFNKVKNIDCKPIRLLDYGCGFGHILDLCNVFGIEAKGVEIDDTRLRYCVSKGLNVCRPEDISEDEKFDIVISENVVEHVNDLNDYFLYIVNRLHVGGIFVFTGLTSKIIPIETRQKKYQYFVPIEHINYFTPLSLKLIIEKYDLKKLPTFKMIQSIESYRHLLYPVAKMYFKEFYPNGAMKVRLFKA